MWQCGLQMSDVDFETSYQSSKACVPNIFIKQTLVFRAVLDLQNFCQHHTESSHMKLPYEKGKQFPFLLTSYLSMTHLSQLTNQC